MLHEKPVKCTSVPARNQGKYFPVGKHKVIAKVIYSFNKWRKNRQRQKNEFIVKRYEDIFKYRQRFINKKRANRNKPASPFLFQRMPSLGGFQPNTIVSSLVESHIFSNLILQCGNISFPSPNQEIQPHFAVSRKFSIYSYGFSKWFGKKLGYSSSLRFSGVVCGYILRS